ncbi:hypothetical protein N321_03412, partial [Antrostomus carolinensis]
SHWTIYIAWLCTNNKVFTRRQRISGCFFSMIFLTGHEMAFDSFVLFQVLFSGSQQCFENYQTTTFYGISGISHSTCKVIQQNLIPLLKSTVQMLEENSKSSLSPET